MLLGGLAIALCVFIFFLFLLTYLHLNMRRNSDRSAMQLKSEKILIVLYIDMILLIIRSAYRVAEYGNLEYHNPISTNEHLFYGLDAAEMLLLNALWIPFHPGKGSQDLFLLIFILFVSLCLSASVGVCHSSSLTAKFHFTYFFFAKQSVIILCNSGSALIVFLTLLQ